jgi:4-amino-4-deoxychorismate lyase
MDGPVRVLVDGLTDTTVPVSDRAFQFGDGLFETVRLAEGRLQLWPRHCQRLQDGASRLRIPLDLAAVERHCQQLTRDVPQGIVRITVTRGDGTRGYAASPGMTPRIVCALYPPFAADSDPHGVRVRVCETRLAEQPRLAGLKHLNRLEQVLARQEWSAPSFSEGLMLDMTGRLVEGTFTNVFLLIDDRLCTPTLHRCGVAGVMRRFILEERPGLGGVEVGECDLWPRDLERASECFLTNALIGVWPVRVVDMPGATRTLPAVTMSRRIAAAVKRRLGFAGSL